MNETRRNHTLRHVIHAAIEGEYSKCDHSPGFTTGHPFAACDFIEQAILDSKPLRDMLATAWNEGQSSNDALDSNPYGDVVGRGPRGQ